MIAIEAWGALAAIEARDPDASVGSVRLTAAGALANRLTNRKTPSQVDRPCRFASFFDEVVSPRPFEETEIMPGRRRRERRRLSAAPGKSTLGRKKRWANL